MSKRTEPPLTSYPAASPANPSLRPDSGEALQTTVISGRKCLGSYARSGPIGCLARMLLGSSTWGSTKRFLTWKAKDTPCKRLYFQLAPSKRGMSAPELLSWALMFPTPLASDTGKDARHLNVYLSPNGVFRKVNPNGTKWSLNLSAAVYYLTPMASDGYRSTLKPESLMKGKPTANLASQIAHLEHPQEAKHGLNPDWVEWLMGFPLSWTDIPFGRVNPKASPA